jgi:hypothetical protein
MCVVVAIDEARLSVTLKLQVQAFINTCFLKNKHEKLVVSAYFYFLKEKVKNECFFLLLLF